MKKRNLALDPEVVEAQHTNRDQRDLEVQLAELAFGGSGALFRQFGLRYGGSFLPQDFSPRIVRPDRGITRENPE